MAGKGGTVRRPEWPEAALYPQALAAQSLLSGKALPYQDLECAPGFGHYVHISL